MIADGGAGTVAAATLAATLTAATALAPFGVKLDILVLGGTCYFGGAAARAGMKLYRTLDATNDQVNVGRAIAALLCTIPIAAVASCIVFLAAHVMGLQADAALGGLLLIMGIRGPEGFQWLVDQLSNVFIRVIPGQGKPLAVPVQPQDQKAAGP